MALFAVAVVIACCGLWFWARARSSSCLAAEVHLNWCRLVGGIVVAVAVTGNCWNLGSGRGLIWSSGCLVTGVQSAWLTKAQSHNGLVRSSKFLEIVLGNSFWWAIKSKFVVRF